MPITSVQLFIRIFISLLIVIIINAGDFCNKLIYYSKIILRGIIFYNFMCASLNKLHREITCAFSKTMKIRKELNGKLIIITNVIR